MHDGTALALSPGNITTIGIGVIVVIVLVGFVLSIVITALLWRLFVLIVVVALAVLVWQQRTRVENGFTARACHLDRTFFGAHVDAPASVQQACARR